MGGMVYELQSQGLLELFRTHWGNAPPLTDICIEETLQMDTVRMGINLTFPFRHSWKLPQLQWNTLLN